MTLLEEIGYDAQEMSSFLVELWLGTCGAAMFLSLLGTVNSTATKSAAGVSTLTWLTPLIPLVSSLAIIAYLDKHTDYSAIESGYSLRRNQFLIIVGASSVIIQVFMIEPYVSSHSANATQLDAPTISAIQSEFQKVLTNLTMAYGLGGGLLVGYYENAEREHALLGGAAGLILAQLVLLVV